jgi:hypothetical protein
MVLRAGEGFRTINCPMCRENYGPPQPISVLSDIEAVPARPAVVSEVDSYLLRELLLLSV